MSDVMILRADRWLDVVAGNVREPAVMKRRDRSREIADDVCRA